MTRQPSMRRARQRRATIHGPSYYRRRTEGFGRSVFAYPTESFYALGVSATDPVAIRQLFKLKKREPGKPIALIAGSLTQVKKYFWLNETESQVAKKYWPGSLTILLQPKPSIAARALFPADRGGSAQGSGARRASRLGRGKIGVRLPAHAGARRLALAAGAPLTATSANISGRPPTKSAKTVGRTFPGILIKPGRCGRQRQPSTVVVMTKKKFVILRTGAVRLT